MSGEGPGEARPVRSATLLETDEDLRTALRSGRAAEGGGTTAPAPAGGSASVPFRPMVRPPVPMLTVFDDGKADGEVIRIRRPRFVIGRTEGDLTFPMDGRMSSRHVEITHQVVGGLHRWVVTDLQSTHGMFVRVSKTALADRAEFLVGGGRYRFDDAKAGPEATIDHLPGDEGASGRTQGLGEGTGTSRPAALTELVGNDIGNRVLLVKDEYWIGTDPTCPICRADDPFCEPRHARLHRSDRGRWHVEHDRTRNGLWLRMAQIVAEAMIYFQVGEQRFRLKVG